MARSFLLHPPYPQAGLLAEPRFHVQMFPERAAHEARALGVRAGVQQDAVADDAVAQQGGRVVEDHEVDQITADDAAERAEYPEERVLDSIRAGRAGIVDQDGDVDVAVRPRGPAGPASEQPGEAHGRLGAQAAREGVAQPPGRGVPAGVGGIHSGADRTRQADSMPGVPAPAGFTVAAGAFQPQRPRHAQKRLRTAAGVACPLPAGAGHRGLAGVVPFAVLRGSDPPPGSSGRSASRMAARGRAARAALRAKMLPGHTEARWCLVCSRAGEGGPSISAVGDGTNADLHPGHRVPGVLD